MDKIIKKDIVNGVEYKYNWIGWGGSITENNVIYISQADYDNLTPAEKADATKNYVIIGAGGIPVPTEIDAEDVNFDNTWTSMQSDNVQDAIEEVFQSVSNGKTLIAAAITDKGVSTAATDSFQTMASNIESLEIATEGQIVAYNMAHSWKWNLLFSIAWWQDHLSTWQQLLLYNGIWWSDYEMYFIWLTTTYSSSRNYECTWYKFFKDWTYTNTNVSTWASVSDNNNWWSPDWENWYTVSDERYRYAFVKRGEDSYQSIAKFDTQTWTLTSDTTVTVNNSWRTLANIKTVLPYTVTSYTTSISVDIHAYDIVAKF